ncbi:MAG: 5'-nucleotidase [Spirochaetaceae bacterium]|nr:MAG: 5'-nucleotidase [Spirochaetaceae bacterium]
MPRSFDDYLVIAVTSRALFDLELENRIFEQQGLQAYRAYQLERQDEVLRPGVAYDLVRKILALNQLPQLQRQVEVVIVSRNNVECALRISTSLEHYDLPITRSAWTSGTPLSHYLGAFDVDLFLSADPGDVQAAINGGIAAARILPDVVRHTRPDSPQIRIAFDGDAVLFADESERVFQEHGLEAFLEHERANARRPLPDGPFARLLRNLALMQAGFDPQTQPIRTALVTARSSPAHERVIRTFAAWNVRIDEAFFLGGMSKQAIIAAFAPDLYFDDQDVHCQASSGVAPTGQVPWQE